MLFPASRESNFTYIYMDGFLEYNSYSHHHHHHHQSTSSPSPLRLVLYPLRLSGAIMIFSTCHVLLYLLGLAGVVSAGFNPDSTKNIAVYWGE